MDDSLTAPPLPTSSFRTGERIPLVLLTGATGYTGGKLLPRLRPRAEIVRCMARDPRWQPPSLNANDATTEKASSKVEVVTADALQPATLAKALAGVHTAYYLIHLMTGAGDFEQEDRAAATHFAQAALRAGVRRIVYLGGLGDDNDPRLSAHLRSRHEVGAILRESGVETIELRASVILGAGSLSFEMIRALTNRLPVMICPRWLATPTQPIAIDDVLDYLLESLTLVPGSSRIYEIGSPDVVNYGELIREYARQKGLRRWLISVPLLTPYLSSLWLGLVTPATARVGRHLVEGLRNPTIVRDASALRDFAIRPMSIRAAIARALTEEKA